MPRLEVRTAPIVLHCLWPWGLLDASRLNVTHTGALSVQSCLDACSASS